MLLSSSRTPDDGDEPKWLILEKMIFFTSTLLGIVLKTCFEIFQ